MTYVKKEKNFLILMLSCLLVFGSIAVYYGSHKAVAKEAVENFVTDNLVEDENGYIQVTFEYLSSFDYEIPEEKDIEQKKFKDQIPQHIKDLDGQRIVVAGFLLPSELDGKKLKKLVLYNSYLGCCFGSIPKMNEWIYATMIKSQKIKISHGMPLTLYGTLEVGEVVDDDGGLSLYRMQGDKVEPLAFFKKKWWQFWRR